MVSCLSAEYYVIVLRDSLVLTGDHASRAVSSEGPTGGLSAG